MTTTCFLALAALGHRVILLPHGDHSGELTVQQVSYFLVPSKEHPGISGIFHTRRETPANQLRSAFSLVMTFL